MSQQEAAYHLASLPLGKFSGEVIFVQSGKPDKRVHFLMPQSEIDGLDNEETEIFQKKCALQIQCPPKQP